MINSENLSDYVFIKVIIPQRLISDIKLYLHGLHINEKSIFPDSENDTDKKNNMEICCKLAIKNIGKQIEAHKIRYFHSTVTSKEIHKCIDNLLNNNSIEAEKSLFFLYNLDIKYYSEEHLKKLCIIYKRNSHDWLHKAILKIISRKKSIAAEQLFKNMGYSRPDDVTRYFINSGFEKYIDLLASWIFNMKSDYDRVNMPKVLKRTYPNKNAFSLIINSKKIIDKLVDKYVEDCIKTIIDWKMYEKHEDILKKSLLYKRYEEIKKKIKLKKNAI